MSSRDAILGAIRATLDQESEVVDRQNAVKCRIAQPPHNLIPDRAQVDLASQVDLFRSLAESVSATTDRVRVLNDVPQAISQYLSDQNLPSQIKSSHDPLLGAIDWSRQPMIDVTKGIGDISDDVGLAVAIAGIAETGTLVLKSGPDMSTTLNFLPETHIVLLPLDRLVGEYEITWLNLRQSGDMPRTVNWITGPSRTGDIEQTMQLGIHGPRRLHIILVDEIHGA